MQLRRMADIVAIRKPDGNVVGFHARNMEVARLSQESWQSMNPSEQISDLQEAQQSLKQWNQEDNPETLSGSVTFGIRSLTLNVTQICNLHCTYCAAGGDGSYGDPIRKISVERTLPQIRSFMEKVPAGQQFRITFLGGEPLLYPEAMALIGAYARDLAQQQGIEIVFNTVTNGTLFNERTLPVLTQLHSHITVSIDGEPSVNDRTRPSKGGQGITQKVITGLQELLKHKGQLGSVGLSGVFGADNMALTSAYKFYSQFDVDWIDFTFDHHNSNPEVSANYVQEISALAADIYRKKGEQGLRKIKFFDHYFDQLDRQSRSENFCGAGKSFLMVDSRNQLYTCPWEVGNKAEVVGVDANLWADKIAPYQDPLIEKNGCQTCWARYLCGGGCMYIHKSSTGSKHTKDVSFCERMRSLIALAIMYYEMSRQPAMESGSEH